MSFCRWSTDDYQCDLYVWEDADGGYAVAVASRRTVYDEPLPEPVPMTPDTLDEWLARWKRVHELPYHYEDIDLPHVGTTFREPTGAAAAERVGMLRKLGYRCPDILEDRLRAEDER